MHCIFKFTRRLRVDRVQRLTFFHSRAQSHVELETRRLVVGRAGKLCQLCQPAIVDSGDYSLNGRQDAAAICGYWRGTQSALRLADTLKLRPSATARECLLREL